MRAALITGVAFMGMGASAAQAMPFDNVYVFGDSLVDSGNIAVFTNGATPDPSTGYFPGRFSDGPALGDWLTFHASGQPLASPSLTGGNNFSFGGARIEENGDPVPDLAVQVGFYGASGITAGSNDLFVVNVGGNDVRDIAFAPGAPPPATAQLYDDLATIVADQLVVLETLGAQNILLMGVPDVGTAPEQVLNGTAGEARDASIWLQDAINEELATRTFTADLRVFDAIAWSDAFNMDPESFGFPPLGVLDTLTPCQVAQTPAPGIDCTGFTSFDGLHPTSAVLQTVAQSALAQTFGVRVSEPATLMLLGFGLLGAAGIRRRRRA